MGHEVYKVGDIPPFAAYLFNPSGGQRLCVGDDGHESHARVADSCGFPVNENTIAGDIGTTTNGIAVNSRGSHTLNIPFMNLQPLLLFLRTLPDFGQRTISSI